MGSVLSFGQDPRWRRFLVSKVNAIPGSWVLDVATGTGLVARELATQERARRRPGPERGDGGPGCRGRAPAGARRAGPVRARTGAGVALPRRRVRRGHVHLSAALRRRPRRDRCRARPGPAARRRHGLARVPCAARTLGSGGMVRVHEIGDAAGRMDRFQRRGTGPVGSSARSITEFVERYPLPVQVRWWQEAGMRRVRTKLLSNGAAVVTWAVKSTPVLGEESEDLAHTDG